MTSDVIQLYARNNASTYGAQAPIRQLVAFAKAEVPSGGTQQVELTFDADALALWDSNGDKLALESGNYTFEVGRSSSDIQRSTNLDVSGSTFANVSDSEKLNVFDRSFAASDVFYRESSKQNTASGLRADELVHGYYTVGARAAGAWTAISNLDFTNAESVTLSLGSTRAEDGRVELSLDAPDGEKVGEFTVGNTGVSAYSIPGAVAAGDVPVKELAYTDVTAELPEGVAGVHDVYLVFADRDVRVRDLSVQRSVVPTVEVTTLTKCTAGKGFLNVTVKNTSEFAVDITIDTVYGKKSFAGVKPDKNAFQSFTTRLKDVPAGEAAVHVEATVDGARLITDTTKAYEASSCK